MRYFKGMLNAKISLADVRKTIIGVPHFDVDDDEELEIEDDGEDLYIKIPIRCEVEEHYTPEVRYLPNGDPGYPAEYEVEGLGDDNKLLGAVDKAKISILTSDIDWNDKDVYGEYDCDPDDY